MDYNIPDETTLFDVRSEAKQYNSTLQGLNTVLSVTKCTV